MKSTAIIQILRKHDLRVFTTADFLTLTGMAPDAATHCLRGLAAQDLLAKLKKGLWVSKLGADVNPYEAVAHLRAPWPTYVSLHSALADYGVISEIPHVIYAVSAALPKRYKTPIGDFHIHHLPPHLIWGYEARQVGTGSYLIADREKAFLDQAYLGLTRRSPLKPPCKRGEKWALDAKKIRAYAKRFEFKPLKAWLASEGIL